MNILIKIFNLMGSLICHQLPYRTIYIEGIPLPLCARDTGIYLGVFISMVFIILLRRLGADKPPELPYSIFMCILMIPMIIDGVGSYLGFMHSNNATRLFTGAFFGFPIPFFLIPAANFKIYSENKKKILKNLLELMAVITVLIVLCLIILNCRIIPYIVLAAVIITSYVFIIARIIYTLTVRVRSKNGKKSYLIAAGATFCFLIILFFISSFILQPLKTLLINK